MMIAEDIKKALAKKHQDDVFVQECTIGNSDKRRWNEGRFDAWAMKKSWANPVCWGYEIKVHRSDFLKDEKWVRYLDFCNSFSFVCPAGIIKPEEVPEQAGLIYVSDTGKLYTKKKAPYRKVDEENLGTMYKRVLMSRAKIVNKDISLKQVDPVEYWEEWLEIKEKNKLYGRMLSGKIRKDYNEKISVLEEENSKLKTENWNLDEIKKMVKDMGIDPGSWRAKEKVSNELMGDAASIVREMKNVRRLVESFFKNNEDFVEKLGL